MNTYLLMGKGTKKIMGTIRVHYTKSRCIATLMLSKDNPLLSSGSWTAATELNGTDTKYLAVEKCCEKADILADIECSCDFENGSTFSEHYCLDNLKVPVYGTNFVKAFSLFFDVVEEKNECVQKILSECFCS